MHHNFHGPLQIAYEIRLKFFTVVVRYANSQGISPALGRRETSGMFDETPHFYSDGARVRMYTFILAASTREMLMR